MGDGVTNDTVAIQNAINAAKEASKVCLFPPGTYLVDQTLKCYKPQVWNASKKSWMGEGGSNSNYRWKTFYLLGSSSGGARPILKLKANSAGFNNTLGPVSSVSEARKAKPVICLGTFCDEDKDGVWDLVSDNGNGVWDTQSEGMSVVWTGKPEGPGEEVAYGNSFYYNVRNIDFDLNGNKSAVAIKMMGAQSCGIQDIKVKATGAWGGFFDIGGPATVNANLEVLNGRVGLYGCPRTDGGASAAGVKLIDQTDYAFYHEGLGMALVGFEITKDSAPAIGMSSAGDYSGGLALIDGKIEFDATNASPAVENTAGGSNEELFMAGVYMKNAGQIVRSGTFSPVPGGSGWKRVSEYAVSDDSANGFNLIHGTKAKGEIKTVADVNETAIPSDLRTRHIWNSKDFPTPDEIFDRVRSGDTTCAIVTEHGAVADDTEPNNSDSAGTDCLAAIQGLIDSGKKYILVPKGKFLIGRNPDGNFGLMLRENTILMGISHNLSEIRSLDSWNPTSETPVVTTVNSPSAASKMAFLEIGFQTTDDPGVQSYEYSWFNGMHWMAGKNSMTRQITLTAIGIYGDSSNNWYRTQARADNFFSGNAGGRHYATIGSGAPVGVDEGVQSGSNQVGEGLFRRFRIVNTTQPLLLYNPNYEDGHDDPQCLVSGSSNVVVYGTKAENAKGFKFLDSTNCAFFAFGGRTDLTFAKCTNVLAAIITPKKSTHGKLTEVGSTSLNMGEALGIFKRGIFDWGAVAIHPPADSAVSSRAVSRFAAAEAD